MEEVVDADMKTSLIDIKLLLESIERGVLKNSGGGGDRGLVDIIKGKRRNHKYSMII